MMTELEKQKENAQTSCCCSSKKQAAIAPEKKAIPSCCGGDKQVEAELLNDQHTQGLV